MQTNTLNSKNKTIFALFVLIITIYTLPGCHTITQKQTHHPLMGKIWSVSQQSYLSENSLIADIKNVDVMLLGETHDNAGHHQLQAQIIDKLVHQQQTPAIAFEMLDQNQQEIIDQFQASGSNRQENTTDKFADTINWEKTGWPEWPYYRPVFHSAIENNLTIIAANLNSTQVRKVIKQGTEVLSPDYQLMLKKYQYDNGLKKELEQDIQSAHCDMLPEKMLAPMLLGQQTRDIAMTLAIKKQLQSPAAEGVILIAGAGHTRTDYGIPYYLQQEMPDTKIISIAFMEVGANKLTPADYAEDWNSKNNKLPFDYVWFTTRAEREDQCEKMRKHMKKGVRK